MEDKEIIKINENSEVSNTNIASPCCPPSSSCCSPSEVESVKEKNTNVSSKTQKIYDSSKVHIDIFVPLNECACLWDQFVNRVFEVLTPFMKHITFSTLNIHSEDARQLKVQSNSVVINGGEKRFTSPFTLQRELPQILKAKGLI
jgi:hypothetical protein